MHAVNRPCARQVWLIAHRNSFVIVEIASMSGLQGILVYASSVSVLRPATETAIYVPASIHEGVRVTDFAKALTSAGLTFSNVAGRGLVIHRIGQDPERPTHPIIEEQA